MDARTRLEAIYKRRIEEAEQKRLLAELRLQVSKQYMTISQDVQPSHMSDNVAVNLLDQLEDIVKIYKNRLGMPEAAVLTIRDQEQLWKDATYISRLELDKISYKTDAVFASTLGELVTQNMKLSAHTMDVQISEGVCLSTDVHQIQKIIRGLAMIFAHLSLDIALIIRHNGGSNMLEITFQEKNAKFFLLKEATDFTDALFERKVEPGATITEEGTLFFVCKSLAQSMGGDLIFDGNQVILYSPCEITDADKCLPSWIKPPPKLSPAPAIPSPPEVKPVHPSTPPIPTLPTVSVPPVPVPKIEVPTVLEVHPTRKSIKGKYLNILLAEDDKILQLMFKRFWQRTESNVTVFIASDGVQATEMFRKQRFAIVFVDIDMPYKNGLEVAKEMRQYEKDNNLKRTPIIGVSGFTERQYKEQALAVGMDDFVSKGTGYQMKDIYRIVEEYCGGDIL